MAAMTRVSSPRMCFVSIWSTTLAAALCASLIAAAPRLAAAVSDCYTPGLAYAPRPEANAWPASIEFLRIKPASGGITGGLVTYPEGIPLYVNEVLVEIPSPYCGEWFESNAWTQWMPVPPVEGYTHPAVPTLPRLFFVSQQFEGPERKREEAPLAGYYEDYDPDLGSTFYLRYLLPVWDRTEDAHVEMSFDRDGDGPAAPVSFLRRDAFHFDSTPRIDEISEAPSRVKVSSQLTIHGINFADDDPDNDAVIDNDTAIRVELNHVVESELGEFVEIDLEANPLAVLRSNLLSFKTPVMYGPGAATVRLTNPSGASVTASFELGPAFEVLSVATVSGNGYAVADQILRILTAGLTGTTPSAVLVNGTLVATDPPMSGPHIVIPAPAGSGIADVTVVTADGQSDTYEGAYTYDTGMVVLGISPDRGPATGGTHVAIRATKPIGCVYIGAIRVTLLEEYEPDGDTPYYSAVVRTSPGEIGAAVMKVVQKPRCGTELPNEVDTLTFTYEGNNSWCDARVITEGAEEPGDLADAVNLMGLPTCAKTDDCFDADSDNREQWWRYRAPAKGRIDLTVCGPGFETHLGIYDGVSRDLLVCNDSCSSEGEDEGEGEGEGECTTCAKGDETYCTDLGAPRNNEQVLCFPADACATYWIRVSGHYTGAESTDYQLKLIFRPCFDTLGCSEIQGNTLRQQPNTPRFNGMLTLTAPEARDHYWYRDDGAGGMQGVVDSGRIAHLGSNQLRIFELLPEDEGDTYQCLYGSGLDLCATDRLRLNIFEEVSLPQATMLACMAVLLTLASTRILRTPRRGSAR